jgi:hypothetical protein
VLLLLLMMMMLLLFLLLCWRWAPAGDCARAAQRHAAWTPG